MPVQIIIWITHVRCKRRIIMHEFDVVWILWNKPFLYNIVITWHYITSCSAWTSRTIWHTIYHLACILEQQVQYYRRLTVTLSRCLGDPNLVCDPDVTNHCTKGSQLYLSQPSTHIHTSACDWGQCAACVDVLAVDRRHQPALNSGVAQLLPALGQTSGVISTWHVFFGMPALCLSPSPVTLLLPGNPPAYVYKLL